MCVAAHDGSKTALAIDDDEVYVRIYELVNENKPLSDPTRLTGRLCAQLHGPLIARQWTDGKTQRLEKVMGTLVATAVDTIQREKAARLDRECIERQKQHVNEVRAAAERALDTEFGRRQKLMEYANRWRDAELMRGYLSALGAAIDADEVHPIDESAFSEWFEWARCYADSVNPILQAKLPHEAPQVLTNKPVHELDLTTRARAILTELNVKDVDELSRVTTDQLRGRYGYFEGEVWKEFTRVLEALGYDVAKREHRWY